MARRRRRHHREFPTAIPRRVAPQQSPLPLRRPQQSTSAVDCGTIGANVVIFRSQLWGASAAPARNRQLATAEPHHANLPGRNTIAEVDAEHVFSVAEFDVLKNGMSPEAAIDKAFKRAEEIFAKYPITQA